MNITVTGATSFLAQKYVESAAKDNQVIAVVREHSRKADYLRHLGNVTVLELNMQDYCRLGEKTGKSDILVHFAWDGTRGEKRNDSDLQKNNYEFSLDAVKSAVDTGCRKIILSGSQAEYGNYSGLITEKTESNPNTEYGKYKLKLYLKSLDYCTNCGTVLVEPRYFSMYGPGDYEGTLIVAAIRRMLANEEMNLTDCTQMWNFLFVDDAVEAVKKISCCHCQSGIYNIASDDTRQLKFFVDEIREIIGSRSNLNYGAVPYGPSGAVNINPSITKIKNALKWSPNYSFKQGIKKTIDWVVNNSIIQL